MTNALRFICAGLLFTALAAPAQALEGAGMLDATEKLKAKGCEKEKLETVLVFALFSNGSWTATDDSVEYSGSWTFCCVKRASEKGRIELDFDPGSLNTLKSVLGERLTTLCGEPVELSSAIRKKFKGKVKNGKAKINAKFKLTDPGDGEEEFEDDVAVEGKWKLKAKGSFTEVTP